FPSVPLPPSCRPPWGPPASSAPSSSDPPEAAVEGDPGQRQPVVARLQLVRAANPGMREAHVRVADVANVYAAAAEQIVHEFLGSGCRGGRRDRPDQRKAGGPH